MLVKRLVLIAAAAAVALGGSALFFDTLARGQASPDAGAGTAVTRGPGNQTEDAPPRGKSQDGDPATGGGESTEPPAAPDPGPPAEAEGGGNSGPGATPERVEADDRPFLEVLPPVSTPPTGLPMPSPPPALVGGPLPETASARGDIVEGFPSHVLSFPDATVTVFTGVSSSGNSLQATAEGISELTPEKVAGHFQQVLLTAGFRSEDAPAAAGQQALRLTRGPDSVSISISTTGTGSTRFSLLGNFRTDPGL